MKKLKLTPETLRNLTPPDGPSQEKQVSSRCDSVCTCTCQTL